MKKFSIFLACCLLALLAAVSGPGAVRAKEAEDGTTGKGTEDLIQVKDADNMTKAKLEGNLLKIRTREDFQMGSTDQLAIDPDIAQGALKLEDGALEGSFVSAIYEGASFTTMVACWNASIYDGTEVEVWARARQDGVWTDWLTWGKYTPYDSRGSKDHKDCSQANVDQDTFSMKDDKTADAVQMMVQLRRDKAETASPVVRMLSMTFKGGDMVPVYAEEPVEDLPDQVMIQAPAYSQKVRHPDLEADICSPTALTVLMNSRDPELALLPEELALNMKDEAEDIFGSWSFGVASAGLYGFQAYPQFCDKNIILQELAKEHSLAVTLKYTNNKDSADLPYLEGVAGETKGHLIALIGYVYEDGIQDDDHLYIYASDSFCDSDQAAYRKYKWTQLEACIKGLAYILPDSQREVEDPYITGVTREEVDLAAVEGQENSYRFKQDGQNLDMTRFSKGKGILACTVDGVKVDMTEGLTEADSSFVYEKAVQSPVNDVFFYDIPCNDDGSIRLNREAVFEKMGIEDKGQAITVYAMPDRGYRYQATLN